MKPVVAALLAAAALGGCSSSEAKEAADASELGYRGQIQRPLADVSEVDSQLDQTLLDELSAEAGMELQGDPVPCVDPPTRVRSGDDWVVDTSQDDKGITLLRPPHWEVGLDIEGWATGDEFGPTLLMVPAALENYSVPDGLSKELRLGLAAATFDEVSSVERLGEDTCFLSGTGPHGQAMAVVIHLPDGNPGATVIGMVLRPVPEQDFADMETALRLVEFGPS